MCGGGIFWLCLFHCYCLLFMLLTRKYIGVNQHIRGYATFSFETWPCALRAPNLWRFALLAFRAMLKNLTQLFAQLHARSLGKPYGLRAEAQ